MTTVYTTIRLPILLKAARKEKVAPGQPALPSALGFTSPRSYALGQPY